MDLKSTHPFWFIKNGLIQSFPALDRDIQCDVAVVGAGITGALVAQRLSGLGQHVVVLDRREAAMGSTSASTSLLQYEIDVMLIDLAEQIGWPAARRAYQLSHQSIDRMEELVQELPVQAEFERKRSLYVASTPADRQRLLAEHQARNECGFDAAFIDGPELKSDYGMDFPCALITDQAATVDAFQLAHGLLAQTQAAGGAVYDRTAVVEIETTRQSSRKMRLKTDRQSTVECDQVIIATGYEAQSMLHEKIVQLKSTYAIVTQPLESLDPWSEHWIMWESHRPYLYLRATTDKRLLVGGEDDSFQDPVRRDQNIESKSATLLQRLNRLFPGMPLEVEYRWAGTFGETRDGLAYIGASPEYPGCFFALGFGGNGITFSSIAADLIEQCMTGTEPVEDLKLFRFGR